MRDVACPACGARVAASFYDGGMQPIATLARARSEKEAREVPRVPLDYVQCIACTHVFNAAFEEKELPTSGAAPGWGMFNHAELWAAFMQSTAERLAASLPKGALVVEFGHGSGDFIARVAKARNDLRCLGFDPWGVESKSDRVELRREMLEPSAIPALGAHLLIARHVLEHVAAPRARLDRIAVACSARPQRVYLEVPCIDRALEVGRTVDFFYEHCQQFTTRSFTMMIEAVGTLEEQGHGYDGEVVWATLYLGDPWHGEIARGAEDFDLLTRKSREAVCAELATLASSGKKIAVWGGAGKSAAFMIRHDMDAVRFPIVVDSDPMKVGTFVAGLGQEIRPSSFLTSAPVDIVIVPPQWRARDIVLEMRAKNIAAQVLIEHEGRLIDFLKAEHPYAKP